MLVDAIATVILAGMMMTPLLNVLVGGIVGAGLAGPIGGLVGMLLAVAITAAETWIADRLGWRDVCRSSQRAADGGELALTAAQTALAGADALTSFVTTGGRRATTRPSSRRSKPRRRSDALAGVPRASAMRERRLGSAH